MEFARCTSSQSSIPILLRQSPWFNPKNLSTGHKVIKAENVVHWAAFDVAHYAVPAKEKGKVKQNSNLSRAAQLATCVGW
jgi:hypothetical protein